MVEGARLESVFTGNRNVGSNPTPSARYRPSLFCLSFRIGHNLPCGFPCTGRSSSLSVHLYAWGFPGRFGRTVAFQLARLGRRGRPQPSVGHWVLADLPWCCAQIEPTAGRPARYGNKKNRPASHRRRHPAGAPRPAPEGTPDAAPDGPLQRTQRSGRHQIVQPTAVSVPLN